MTSRSSLALAALLLAVAPVAAQRTRLYADVDRGYEVRVPRWLEVVPTKPGDDQTLAKFQGVRKSSSKPYKGDQELVLLVVRIPKQDGAETGPETPAGEAPDSLADQRVARLNSARSLEGYLRLRFRGSGELVSNEQLNKRPLTDPDGREYEVLELPAEKGGAVVRAFVLRDDAEVFGVIAVGFGLNPFHADVCRVVKSLRREVRRPGPEDGDPYADSSLRDIEGRRAVRGELVHGWTAHDSENFILVTNVDSSRMVERMLGDLEIMRKAYLERFPPAEAADMDPVSTVRVCDGYEDYLRYAGRNMMGTGGYWNFVEEELVLFDPDKQVPRALRWTQRVDPTAVLYHEAMHQYFHYSNRALAPGSWFNEGYGEVFGAAQLDRRDGVVKRIGKNSFRLELVRLDRKKKNPPPQLTDLLAMPKRVFYAKNALRNYAYGWAFCHFLETERQKSDRSRNDAWAQLPDRYLRELRTATEVERDRLPDDAPEDWISKRADAIQKTAIEATLAEVDMAELQKEWERFLRRL